MASDQSSRSFLSGDLIWGVKQSDPFGAQYMPKFSTPIQLYAPKVKPKRSRFLSEQPSTYLR